VDILVSVDMKYFVIFCFGDLHSLIIFINYTSGNGISIPSIYFAESSSNKTLDSSIFLFSL